MLRWSTCVFLLAGSLLFALPPPAASVDAHLLSPVPLAASLPLFREGAA